MQNLIVLTEPKTRDWISSSKYGNMLLNLFCIDEEAAFEFTEIRYVERESKGKGYFNLTINA